MYNDVLKNDTGARLRLGFYNRCYRTEIKSEKIDKLYYKNTQTGCDCISILY